MRKSFIESGIQKQLTIIEFIIWFPNDIKLFQHYCFIPSSLIISQNNQYFLN